MNLIKLPFWLWSIIQLIVLWIIRISFANFTTRRSLNAKKSMPNSNEDHGVFRFIYYSSIDQHQVTHQRTIIKTKHNVIQVPFCIKVIFFIYINDLIAKTEKFDLMFSYFLWGSSEVMVDWRCFLFFGWVGWGLACWVGYRSTLPH